MTTSESESQLLKKQIGKDNLFQITLVLGLQQLCVYLLEQ